MKLAGSSSKGGDGVLPSHSDDTATSSSTASRWKAFASISPTIGERIDRHLGLKVQFAESRNLKFQSVHRPDPDQWRCNVITVGALSIIQMESGSVMIGKLTNHARKSHTRPRSSPRGNV